MVSSVTGGIIKCPCEHWSCKSNQVSEKLQLWLYFTHKCCVDWKQLHNCETCEQPIQYLIILSLSVHPWLVAETHGGLVWSMHEVLTFLPPFPFLYRPAYAWNIANVWWFLCVHACESAFRDQRACPLSPSVWFKHRKTTNQSSFCPWGKTQIEQALSWSKC